MANSYSPFGFRPFGNREGVAPTAGMERLFILSSDANTYFTGDVVSLSSGTTGTNPNTISPWSLSSGYIPVGVFVGCEYYSPTVGRVVWNSYFPGNVGSSSPCNAYVITNPDQRFIAQVSTTSGVVGASVVGFGISIATSQSSQGNTFSGQSAQALASSNLSLQASSSPFKVVDVYANYAPPGVNGTSTGAEGAQILIVQPNNWLYKGLQAAST